jgi:hypothetical protein
MEYTLWIWPLPFIISSGNFVMYKFAQTEVMCVCVLNINFLVFMSFWSELNEVLKYNIYFGGIYFSHLALNYYQLHFVILSVNFIVCYYAQIKVYRTLILVCMHIPNLKLYNKIIIFLKSSAWI